MVFYIPPPSRRNRCRLTFLMFKEGCQGGATQTTAVNELETSSGVSRFPRGHWRESRVSGDGSQEGCYGRSMEVTLVSKPAEFCSVQTRFFVTASGGGMRLLLWRSARCVCDTRAGGGRWPSQIAHCARVELGREAAWLHTSSGLGALLQDKCTSRLGYPAVQGLHQVRCELQEGRGLKLKTDNKKPIGKKVGAPRGPLWRTRKSISKEVVQAVQDLKRTKTPSDLVEVFKLRLSRLLKVDLIGVLHELQRQDEVALAVKVFDYMRKEAWYKPDLFLYRDLLDALGRNKSIEKVEYVWSLLESETQPELVVWTELIGAYLRNNLNSKAVEAFERMRETGIEPDHFTYSILIKALWKADEKEIASKYRDERMRTFPEMEASI